MSKKKVVRRLPVPGRRPAKASRVLLVDADIPAYHCVDAAIEEAEEGPDEWVWRADLKAAKADFEKRVRDLERELGGRAVLCYGSRSNWRTRVLPTYKKNRDRRKPVGYAALVEWSTTIRESRSAPWLEADDVVGLLHTAPEAGGLTIAVSEDKDFCTLPGMRYNPREPEKGVVQISEAQADYAHLKQALTGDASDGYAGCPGVGPVKADAVLAVAAAFGDRAGMWAAVVAAFEKAGLAAEQALQQARVARILRHREYDWETGALKLWEPPKPKDGGG